MRREADAAFRAADPFNKLINFRRMPVRADTVGVSTVGHLRDILGRLSPYALLRLRRIWRQ